MEVLYDPPLFVKAQKTDKLHLPAFDRVYYSDYRSILLAYMRTSDIEKVGGEAIHDPVRALRHGVEEIVASHYPWAAGRLQVNEAHGHLDAIGLQKDGGGVQFVSAHASCALAQLGDLADPNPAFEPLFATIDITAPLHARPLVALQVTKFEDDGICVSMNCSHALFDGVAASTFLQNICSIARGVGVCKPMDLAPRVQRIKPVVMAPQVQCPTSELRKERWTSMLQALYTNGWTPSYQSPYHEPLAATRFKFHKEDLVRIQDEALSKQEDCVVGFDKCSRFAALVALIWRAKAKSEACSREASDEFRLRIAMNVRGRIIASTPVCNYMGNAVCTALPMATVGELMQKSLAFAVERVQEAMKLVTIERFQAEVDCLERLGGSAGMVPTRLSIASLVGVGFNEADFGWGKPACIGQPSKQRRNHVILSEGDKDCSSWNVFVVLDSPFQLQKFQNALRLAV